MRRASTQRAFARPSRGEPARLPDTIIAGIAQAFDYLSNAWTESREPFRLRHKSFESFPTVHKPFKYFFRWIFPALNRHKALPGKYLSVVTKYGASQRLSPYWLYVIVVTVNIESDDTKPARIIRRF